MFLFYFFCLKPYRHERKKNSCMKPNISKRPTSMSSVEFSFNTAGSAE